jgi:hypothetical protein
MTPDDLQTMRANDRIIVTAREIGEYRAAAERLGLTIGWEAHRLGFIGQLKPDSAPAAGKK